MSQTRLDARDGLRYAMFLADALRQIHDRGQVHGALTPHVVLVAENEIRLIPGEMPAGTISPYTAPEVAAGQPADARSDIFSFGAIAYELMTGRPAFSGSTSEALADALANSEPAPSGSASLDRILTGCLAKSPASRWHHLRKVQLELKLLAAALRRGSQESAVEASRKEVRRLESLTATRLDDHASAIARLHEELAQIPVELRVQLENQQAAAAERAAVSDNALAEGLARVEQAAAERLAAIERATAERLAEIELAATERLATVEKAASESLAGAGHELVVLRERVDAIETGVRESLREMQGSLREEMATLAADAAKPATERVAAAEQVLDNAVNRLAALQHEIEGDRNNVAASEATVTASLRQIERSIKDLAASVESTRVATAQTDGLLERVVEALDSLQSSVL